MPVDNYGVWYSGGPPDQPKPAPTYGGAPTYSPAPTAPTIPDYNLIPGEFPQSPFLPGFGNFSPTPEPGQGGGIAQMPTGIGGSRGGGGGSGPAPVTAPDMGASLRGTPTVTGTKPTTEQDVLKQQFTRNIMQQILSLFSGGGPGFTPANVPDFRAEAMKQAELARLRSGQRGAEEAAVTGEAGSRDQAYRQSLLDEALFNAAGGIGAEQAGRQFTANLQAKQLEAQQQIAQFQNILRLLTALGGLTG